MKDKTLRISLLLVAAFLCGAVVSCSDDDPQPATSTTETEPGPVEEPESTDEPEPESTGKKLVQIYYYDTSEGYCSEDVSYDKKGKVEIINSVDFLVSYSWSDNSIVETFHDDMRENVFVLSDGIISSYTSNDGNKASYEYDSSNQLTSVNNISANYSSTFTWDNEQLLQIESDNKDISVTFTYSGQTCNGYIPLYFVGDAVWEALFCDDEDGLIIYITNPELMGLKLNQLPSKVSTVYRDYSYSYELDSDNYVISYTTSDGGYHDMTYYLVWE